MSTVAFLFLAAAVVLLDIGFFLLTLSQKRVIRLLKQSLSVKIGTIDATELKPTNKYLLVIDRTAASGEDVHYLLKHLKTMGIENSVVLMTNGDPYQGVQVIEQE